MYVYIFKICISYIVFMYISYIVVYVNIYNLLVFKCFL